MSDHEHAIEGRPSGSLLAGRTHLLKLETSVVVAAWLVALSTALVLAAVKGVPSPLRILFHEIVDNTTRNWYWVGAVLPANLVALSVAPNRRERLRILAIATLVAVGCAVLSYAFLGLKDAIYVGAKFCAIFGVLAVASQWRQPGGVERLLVVVMFSTYLAIRLSYLPLTDILRTDTLDLYPFAFDKSLGFDVAAWLFYFYHNSHIVSAILNAAYVLVLLLPLSLYAAQNYRTDHGVSPMLRVFILATSLGFFCYFIFPACGPVYLFGPLGMHLALSGSPHPVPLLGCWRNGVPSVHFAIVLLMTINVPRSLRSVKFAFIGYCILTFMSTLGTGEHYFADLVAALPFVCAVQSFSLWLNAPRANRRLLFASARSLLVFVAFLVYLFFVPEEMRTMPYSWAIVILTVAHFAWELHGWRQAPQTAEGDALPAQCPP